MLNTSPVTPNQALEALIELYPLRLSHGLCAMLHGSPGIGKSETVAGFAERIGGQLIDVRLGQIVAEDLRGLPQVGEESSRFVPPSFLPRDGKGVLFLDEFSCAEPRVQNAALELLLDRRLGDYRLPDGWFIVAAGNAAEHGAMTFSLSSAVADRMVHFSVVADPDAWLKWAGEKDIAAEVMAFIRARPDLLDGIQSRVRQDHVIGPSPRGWFRVSGVVRNVKPGRLRDQIVAGIVGLSAATEFSLLMDEIKHMAPIGRIMEETNPRARLKLLPTTMNGLYVIAYAIPAQVRDEQTLKTALSIITQLNELEVDPTVPLTEIQRMAMELLAEKAQQAGLSGAILSSPDWHAYRQTWGQLAKAG